MLFQPSSVQGTELRRYVDLGAYDLAIDNGRETLEITGQDAWSSIERGTTIFMNIVLVRPSYKNWCECPICHTRNYLRDDSERFIIDWYVMMLLIDDISIYIQRIAAIVRGDCKVRIFLKVLTGHRWRTKRSLNLFVTSVSIKL